MSKLFGALFAALVYFSTVSGVSAASLLTMADRTSFTKTGRYEEVVRLCGDFQKEFPAEVRCFEFGRTPEGRPMKALAISGAGFLTAAQAKTSGQPVLFFQGGIHSGEIDGKDAAFWWAREALRSKNPALKSVTIVIVPVFNIDGHERFGAHNRPNQVGPEEMGWRVTGQNLNLNRDYMKAEAPEMQAMLKLLNEWDPIVYVDMHVTDGAQFQHSVSLNFIPNHLSAGLPEAPAGNKELSELSAKLEEAVRVRLDGEGFLPVTFYPDFVTDDEPTSGFKAEFSSPRFSEAYWGTRNRIGFLLETHSWKDYRTRVKVTHDTLDELVIRAAQDGKSWVQAAHRADEAAKSLGGKKLVLRYEANSKSHPIAFQGYAYKKITSPVTGQPQIVYDPTHKEVWNIPLFDELEPSVSVTLPGAGYIVPAAQAAWVARKLQLHAIRFEVIHHAIAGADVATFRSENPEFAAKSFEGRQTLKVSGEWKPEKRDILAGSLFIPIAQPRAILIANLLEPASDDSLLAWGFFNGAFEHKEYMETYVNESVAEEMLKDPAIKAEFEAKLKDDSFAKSAEKRFEFFYRKHPSWDERFGLYPVYRVSAPLSKS